MRKKVLGKGLGALIPEIEASEAAPREIDIDQISPNPDQPRLKMDEKSLEELTRSIRENGILQPILVRPWGAGFQLIAGERRLLAAQRAGLLRIPAVVREASDEKLLLLAMIENLQREQLNPIEEAQGYHTLIDNLRSTQEAVAGHLGKERSTVANALRLLKLPPAVKLLVAEGRLSPGHARALLASECGAVEMTKAAQSMVDQGWSVRDAEKWARGRSKHKSAPAAQDPNVAAAAERLQYLYGTKVEIVTRGKQGGAGVIRIYFHDDEDLSRVYSLMTGKPH
jgi:ParB family chromosome partitioning protein